MARTVLNLKQQKQEIALTDEANSPVYYLDFSDSQVTTKAKEIYNYYLENKTVIDRIGGDDEESSDAHIAADLFRKVIEELLGEKAFQEIVAYVRDSEISKDASCDDILLLLAPLVLYLVDEIAELVVVDHSALREKYLGTTNADNVV